MCDISISPSLPSFMCKFSRVQLFRPRCCHDPCNSSGLSQAIVGSKSPEVLALTRTLSVVQVTIVLVICCALIVVIAQGMILRLCFCSFLHITTHWRILTVNQLAYIFSPFMQAWLSIIPCHYDRTDEVEDAIESEFFCPPPLRPILAPSVATCLVWSLSPGVSCRIHGAPREVLLVIEVVT
jgi:hypothetical protein